MQSRAFTVSALTKDDGWVDDVNSSYYNQFIKLSDFENNLPNHENLWLENDKYDIIAIIGYNDNPIIKGKGSAIFMRVAGQTATGQYVPTLGCVAFLKQDLLKILDTMTPKTYTDIPNKPGTIVFKNN